MSKKMHGSTVAPTPPRTRTRDTHAHEASAVESSRRPRAGEDDDRTDDETESHDEVDEAGSEMDEER